MTSSAIELCDGLPSDVESNLDYWVDTVRYFCPWSGKIVGMGLPDASPSPSPSFTLADLKTLLQNYEGEVDNIYQPVDNKVNMLDSGYVMKWLML